MNTIARFALGHPLSTVDEEASELPQVAAQPGIELAGRVLLATIFLLSAFMKFFNYGEIVSYADAAGLPNPTVMVAIGGVVELLGGLSLVAGLLTRIGALALTVFLVLAAYYFHDFWLFTGAERQIQLTHFLKNVAIIGGMLLLVVHGAGRYSIDWLLRERLGRAPRPSSPE
jgi:putative oxidoreductase